MIKSWYCVGTNKLSSPDTGILLNALIVDHERVVKAKRRHSMQSITCRNEVKALHAKHYMPSEAN
jgi:hypothetical protein